MRLIIQFERFYLLPIDIVAALITIWCFIKLDWIGGFVFIIAWILIGAVGQSLHRNLTAKELADGIHLNENHPRNIPVDYVTRGNLTGRAIFSIFWLAVIVTTIICIHWGLKWWSPLYGLASGFISFVWGMLSLYDRKPWKDWGEDCRLARERVGLPPAEEGDCMMNCPAILYCRLYRLAPKE